MSSTPIEVVALALQRESDSKYFLARRGPGSSGAGHWEFPGGKINDFETQTEALVREIKEELTLSLNQHDLFYVASHFFQYPTKKIHLHLWSVKVESTPAFQLTEHDQFLWCRPNEMESLSMSPADLFFINKLL